MKTSALALAFVAVLSVSRSAGAQPSDVDQLIERGIRLREQKKDDLALEEFNKAFLISHGPRAQTQIALAEQALGRWVQAESDMMAALAADSDPWIAANRRALEKALTVIREHLGDLELRGGVQGADVLVNGVRVASMPLDRPVRVEAGTCVIEVKAAGYYPLTRQIMITPNGTSREVVDLRPSASGGVRGQADGAATLATASPPASLASVDVQPLPTTRSHALEWAGVGSAAALLTIGVVGLVVRNDKATSFNGDPACLGTGDIGAQPASCRDLASSTNTWQAVSAVGFAGAAVLAGATAVLFAFDHHSPQSSARTTTRFACTAAISPDITCRLIF